MKAPVLESLLNKIRRRKFFKTRDLSTGDCFCQYDSERFLKIVLICEPRDSC